VHEVGAGMVSLSKQGETKDGLGGRFKMGGIGVVPAILPIAPPQPAPAPEK